MAVNPDGVSFSHDELDNALTIVTASSMYYVSETDRMEALRTVFGNLVSPDFLKPRTLYSREKEAMPDSSVYCSDCSIHNVVIAVVEGRMRLAKVGLTHFHKLNVYTLLSTLHAR